MKKILYKFILLILVVWGIIVLMRMIYPHKFISSVKMYSEKYNLEEELVFATIKTESNFIIDAKSNKDARGLMQIMPKTGEWIASILKQDDYEINDLYNPDRNIEYGCWYLRYLIDRYKDINVAIAAYNAGQGNVDDWLQEIAYSKDGKTLYKIPFKETDKYVKKMTINKGIYQIIY